MTPPATAIMANTEEEAPRSPAQETRRHCLTEQWNGFISKNTATGLAINVRIIVIIIAVKITSDISCGIVNSPNRKNIKICAKDVTPSKNGMSVALL